MNRILQFTEEHETFRAMARKFFETEVAPNHESWEKVGGCSEGNLEKSGCERSFMSGYSRGIRRSRSRFFV